MRVRLTRSGGYAGITLEREIETETLPAADRDLLAPSPRARREGRRSRGEGLAPRDAFVYQVNGITVTGEREIALIEKLLRAR